MMRNLFCAILLFFIAAAAVAQDGALFAQTASATLDRQFGSAGLSWILLDGSGTLLARNWPEPDRAIPPGSLLKPFVALAWGEEHGPAFPRLRCRGTRDRCWLPRGHGRPDLEDALAESCNAYFLALSSQLDIARARATFSHLGLAGPSSRATPVDLIGLSSAWREKPLVLARAYLRLLDRSGPARDSIAIGMQRAAQTGTAEALDRTLGPRAALAKTGTARCTHHPRAAADGFSVALYPADQPRLLLLVRMHGATGAQCSARAAAMLASLGAGAK